MESLLENYGSSDEEDGGREEKPRSPPPSKPFSSSIPPPSSASALFSSLPPPKSSSSSSSSAAAEASIISSSSLFSSLPPPKSSSIYSSLPPPKSSSPSAAAATTSSSSLFSSLPPHKASSSSSSSSSSSPSSSSLFSSLPPPRSQQPEAPPTLEPNAKRVVQFRPPINPSLFKPDDADEDDDEGNGKGKKWSQDFSSKPLSSIIPPPKNTLGLGPSSRRSIIDADVPVRSSEASSAEDAARGSFGDQGGYGGQGTGGSAAIGVDAPPDSGAVAGDAASSWAPSAESYGAYGAYGSYEGYDNYGSFGGAWDYGSSAVGTMSATEIPEPARTAVKRGRDDIPSEVIEVKQDELIKNRPREDQGRLTGIAFGPSYQPAPSAKGKPSKLHRRKHQIGSLYYDMRQKEMELSERRAKGLLTKKETQAKYGW